MKPVRLSLPHWRLMLLAALVLLTGAMGDSVSARLSAGMASGCAVRGPDHDRDCDSRLTAPAQTALLQGLYRIDGKAAPTTAGGIDPLLPFHDGLSPTFVAVDAPAIGPARPRGGAMGPTGRPRGPPVAA